MLTISRGVSTALRRIAFNSRPTLEQNGQAYAIAAANYCSEKASVTPEPKQEVDNENERTEVIPVEVSMRYLQSAAYNQTYGEQFVWEQYRRNHKGYLPPIKTRKTCIRKGVISTGNPCPICRDKYLVLDRRNLALLKQFISPQTGKVLKASKTGLCQRTQQQLMVAVEQAFDYGLIEFDVPFREYDYSEYYKSS